MSGTESLKSLHTTLIDAEKGYETAIRDAQAPDMKAIFEQLSALHARAHDDVHKILIGRGERPDESGSFLSVVHKAVISVRAAVAGLDRTSLPSFVDGEERIVGVYDRAIAETTAADPAREALQSHRRSLLAVIADMKAKAA